MFFDALGIKWWYEPEGFSLRFDYTDFAASWNMDEKELLEVGVPQTFAHLDGKEYKYLPDFYLPELHCWVEIKGPNPTKEEIEKAFLLDHMAADAAEARMDKAKTLDEAQSAIEHMARQGVYIIYGDIPWPFPQKGNIFGYGGRDSVITFFIRAAIMGASGTVERESKAPEYRSLLRGGQLNLCWQECPLCLRIGVGRIGTPYCQSCHDQIAMHLWDHLPRYRVMSEAGTQDTSGQVTRDVDVWAGRKPPNPANAKALELTKGLINPEFFTSGHKSPKLQEAYNAARSARFEHGQSP